MSYAAITGRQLLTAGQVIFDRALQHKRFLQPDWPQFIFSGELALAAHADTGPNSNLRNELLDTQLALCQIPIEVLVYGQSEEREAQTEEVLGKYGRYLKTGGLAIGTELRDRSGRSTSTGFSLSMGQLHTGFDTPQSYGVHRHNGSPCNSAPVLLLHSLLSIYPEIHLFDTHNSAIAAQLAYDKGIKHADAASRELCALHVALRIVELKKEEVQAGWPVVVPHFLTKDCYSLLHHLLSVEPRQFQEKTAQWEMEVRVPTWKNPREMKRLHTLLWNRNRNALQAIKQLTSASFQASHFTLCMGRLSKLSLAPCLAPPLDTDVPVARTAQSFGKLADLPQRLWRAIGQF